MTELTKDADILICSIYAEYMKRVKNNISKIEANNFNSRLFLSNKVLSKCNPNDLELISLEELRVKKLVSCDILGNFELTSNGIIYMENRFKEGLSQVIDYLQNLTGLFGLLF